MTERPVGISGFAAYLPPYRVPLEAWCRWTGDSWAKIGAVVGQSFRMRGPDENAYTMAATAVLRLIEQYDVDPQTIGYLALGTESSTDNSAGAVIVKGMVNDGLALLGRAPLCRQCEVPEFKHACLGGVYAVKSAARYLALDGAHRKAIVVCSDIAEYARGTSGEPTQGAGAVAMLIERDPTLLTLALEHSGSASDYRGADFRKPFSRFSSQEVSQSGQVRDFPVFNGKYSTTCYLDEVLVAMDDMFSKMPESRFGIVRDAAAVFLHRPYLRMAETGLAASMLYALATDAEAHRERLAGYAIAAGVDADALISELRARPNLYALIGTDQPSTEVFPLTQATLRALREHPDYQTLVRDKLRLGNEAMLHCGNLYTASLPVWMAAGLEQALHEGLELAGERVLTIGYGSGDAAEAIPLTVVPGWQDAAARIGFDAALGGAIDIDQANYERLHDTGMLDEAPMPARDGVFVIERVGQRQSHFDDSGIEYYRYRR
jgi:hydroxymethylglutaryl-CoA synthase